MLYPDPTTSRTRPQCIDHRGDRSTLPVNTMKAFASAIEAGADAIETDVHMTKDRQVVLSHVSNCCSVTKFANFLINCSRTAPSNAAMA